MASSANNLKEEMEMAATTGGHFFLVSTLTHGKPN